MANDPEKITNDTDHEIWLKCFTAALGGTLSRYPQSLEPPNVVSQCGELADLALKEEQKRRR